ncbi:MAG TPA: hypothetical protein VGS98_13250 [Thermoanaerobaculia bacterium]|nr:hypothetical protein [Thermoanaerobaculia bacterium]
MKNRKRAAVGLVVCCVTAAAIAAAPKKSSPVRYGFPKLRPGQLWISSVPVGLEVYLGPKVDGKPIGRTPLLLDARTAGAPVTVDMPKKGYGAKLPDQLDLVDFTAETTHSIVHKDGEVVTDLSRALTYRSPLHKPTLIALFQPRSAELSEWARRYPPGRNFSFREERVRKDLAGRGVPSVQVDLGIELLHRGGKVALPGRDGWLIAEVQPSGDVTVIGAPR